MRGTTGRAAFGRCSASAKERFALASAYLEALLQVDPDGDVESESQFVGSGQEFAWEEVLMAHASRVVR